MNLESFGVRDDVSISPAPRPGLDHILFIQSANGTSNERSTPKIYEDLIQLHTGKPDNAIKKLPEDLSRRFSNEDTQGAHGHRKRCSRSLATGEMQTETPRQHPSPVRTAAASKPTDKSAGEDVGRGDPAHRWWERSRCSRCGKQCGETPQKLNMELPYGRAHPLSECVRKNPKLRFERTHASPCSRPRSHIRRDSEAAPALLSNERGFFLSTWCPSLRPLKLCNIENEHMASISYVSKTTDRRTWSARGRC